MNESLAVSAAERSLTQALAELHAGNTQAALQATRDAERALTELLRTQARQITPPDPRFNSPLKVPLDNTASVVDFVSHPQGDRIDRVRYEITGMNQNPSLPGGRARLVLSASCFGEGTESVSFNVDGRASGCGKTILNKVATASTSKGTVTIAVRAPSTKYVYTQWVLTGRATRVR